MTGIILHICAAVLFFVVGYTLPQQTASALSGAETIVSWLANAFNATGQLALLLQFAGVGFVVVMTALVLVAGALMRNVSKRLFRWSRIIIATTIPIFAHVVKWGLGLWWPILLVPVKQLADFIISQLEPTTQVTVELFHARDHLMTFIIGIMILIIILLIKKLVRRPPGSRTTRTPTSPSEKNKKGFVMPNPIKWVWRMLTLPFRWINKKDRIIGPILWPTILIMLAITVSFILTTVLAFAGEFGVKKSVFIQNPFGDVMFNLIWFAVCTLLLLPKWEEKETISDGQTKKTWALKIFRVPGPAKGAQLSWFGMITPFLLETGDYPLLGESLGFKHFPIEPRINDGKEVPRTIADKDGFILLGDITFQVWQDPSANSVAEKTTITLQAGNGATVSGNLSFVLEGYKRIAWVIADDSGLQVGNRARQELQESKERFVDTDIKSIQGDIGKLLRGETMLTCFLPKSIEGHKQGSILRDLGGKPIYVFVSDFKPTADATAEDVAKTELLKRVSKSGDTASKVILHKDENGEFFVAEVTVTTPITEVIKERGFNLKQVIFDNIRASKDVEDASNAASSQAMQADAQMAGARANKAVRQELLPTEEEKNDPHYALRVTLAAAQDPDNKGGVKVVHLAGGDAVTRGVVGAGLIEAKGD